MGDICQNCGEVVGFASYGSDEGVGIVYHIQSGRARCWSDRAEVAWVDREDSDGESGRGLAEAPDGVEWRVVEEFPAYEVSSLGEVRRISDGFIPSRVMRGGGRYYNLQDDGGNWRIRSGRTLLAAAFRGEINWRR